MRQLFISFIGKEIIMELEEYTLRGKVLGGDKHFLLINTLSGPRYVNINMIQQFIVLELEANPPQSETPPEKQQD